MLVLDTNVVSELMKPRPDEGVLEWLDTVPMEELATTAITVMEVRFGLALLPHGRRRVLLESRFRQFLARGFSARLLAFDEAAAEECSLIRASRRRAGVSIAAEDGMIAAIARARGATVVTRDGSGFAGCGVPVLNPWR